MNLELSQSELRAIKRSLRAELIDYAKLFINQPEPRELVQKAIIEDMKPISEVCVRIHNTIDDQPQLKDPNYFMKLHLKDQGVDSCRPIF